MSNHLKQRSWIKPTAPVVPAKKKKPNKKVERPEQPEGEVNHG